MVAAIANLVVTVIPDNRNSTGLKLCVNIVLTPTSRMIISSSSLFFVKLPYILHQILNIQLELREQRIVEVNIPLHKF